MLLLVPAQDGFFMNWAGNQEGEGFEYHLLAIALLVALLFKGTGAFSVDHVLYRYLSGHHAASHPGLQPSVHTN